tara:strand:+ start:330 stop:485 length:156 start_codon:yes stop_codon:yes gene_type:complete
MENEEEPKVSVKEKHAAHQAMLERHIETKTRKRELHRARRMARSIPPIVYV